MDVTRLCPAKTQRAGDESRPLQRVTGATLVCLAALLLGGCGGGGDGSSTGGVQQPGAGPGTSGAVPPAPSGGVPTGPSGGGSSGGGPDVPPQPDPTPAPTPTPPPIAAPPAPRPLGSWSLTDVHAMALDAVTGDVYYLDLVGRLFALRRGATEPIEVAGTSAIGAHGLAFASFGSFYAVIDMPGGTDDVLMALDLDLGATRQKVLTGYADVESLVLVQRDGAVQMHMVDRVVGEVLTYDLDTDTLTGVPIQGGLTDLRGLTPDPDREALVAIDATQHVVLTLDPATGATRVLRDRVPAADALVYDPSSRHYHASSATSGSVRELDLKGADLDLASIRGLAHEPVRDVYFGSHVATALLVEITRSSGWKRVIGYTAVPDIEGLAYDAAGERLFGVSRATQSLFHLSVEDGTATEIGPVVGPGGPWASISGLAFGRGRLFAVDTDSSDLLAIDPSSGGATVLATLTPFQAMHGLAFDPNAPGTGDDLLITYDDATQAPILMPADAPGGGAPGERADVGVVGGLTWVMYGPQVVGTDVVNDALVRVIDEAPPTVGFDAVHALAWAGTPGILLGGDVASETLIQIETTEGRGVGTRKTPTMQFEAMACDASVGTCFAVDAASASLVEVGPYTSSIDRWVGSLPAGMRALALDGSTGRLYGVNSDTDELIQISSVDASWVSMQAAPMIADRIEGLTFANGQLLGFDRATRTLIRLDPATGFEAPLPAIADTSIDIAALAWDADTGTLFAVDLTTDRLVRIAPSTGQLVSR